MQPFLRWWEFIMEQDGSYNTRILLFTGHKKERECYKLFPVLTQNNLSNSNLAGTFTFITFNSERNSKLQPTLLWMSKCVPEGFPQDTVFLSFWVWGYFDCEVDTIMANVHIHNKRNSKQIISIDNEQSVTKEGHSCHQLFHMKMFVWWRHWSTRLRSKIPVIAVWYL